MTATTAPAGALWQKIADEAGGPQYRFGTHRAVSPPATLRRIAPLLPLAGITRLADVTGLDWIGLPVYQAVRPNSRNISVSQGKGLTRAQAKVSALMESLEGFHAEEIRLPALRASVGELRPALGYDPYTLPTVRDPAGALAGGQPYDPFAPPVGRPARLRDDSRVDWVEATDLWSGAATWVPRQLCELNFCLGGRAHIPLFRASSNGLASGNTVTEALIHGLSEVIERDATWRGQDARSAPERWVDPASVPSRLAQQVLERFARAGMRTRIVEVSSPAGLPCFEVFLEHAESASRYYGAGCHPSPLTALLRALTEAAQSRLAHIAGSRDDLYRRTYHPRVLEPGGPAPAEAARRSFRAAPQVRQPGWTALLRELVRRVRAVTGVSPLAVDLSRPEFGLPVVFVVAPGLQLTPPERQ